MKFIKYCNDDYNIKNPKCDSIQIGTLNYYRSHPNENISDSREGMVNHVRFISGNEGMKISGEFSQFLTGFDTIGLRMIPNSYNSFLINHKYPNWYVFSCSKETKAQETTQNNLNYNSSYEIQNIDEFNKIVCRHILEHLEIKFDFKKNFTIATYDALIRYEINDMVVFTSTPKPKDMLFIKREKFSWQKEYRFLWTLVNNDTGKYEDVPEDLIYVPLTPELKNCFNSIT